MKDRTRYILLTIIGILILITIAMQAAYAFLDNNIEGSGTGSSVELKTCAQIRFTDLNQNSISLPNSYPMDDMFGLQTEPYKFTIISDCEGSASYSIYLIPLLTDSAENTLDENAIHFAIRDGSTKELVANDRINSNLNATSDFTDEDIKQFAFSPDQQYKNIYKIYTDTIADFNNKEYYLYLWVDKDVTDPTTMNKVFSASVAIKNN